MYSSSHCMAPPSNLSLVPTPTSCFWLRHRQALLGLDPKYSLTLFPLLLHYCHQASPRALSTHVPTSVLAPGNPFSTDAAITCSSSLALCPQILPCHLSPHAGRTRLCCYTLGSLTPTTHPWEPTPHCSITSLQLCLGTWPEENVPEESVCVPNCLRPTSTVYHSEW